MVNTEEHGDDFTSIPAGSSMDTFEDTLNDMDGTDPADNLSPVGPKSTDDGFPKTKEFQGPVEDELDGDADSGPVEPATEAEEEESETEEVGEGEYTEGDRLKELGHDYDSIEEFTAAQQEERESEANALREIFAKQNVHLQGTTPAEIAQELAVLAANAPAQPGAKNTTTSDPGSDDISQAIDGLLKQYDLSGDDSSAKFYKDFGEKVAGPYRAMQQELAETKADQELFVDKMLYFEAKAAAKGDEPIPPFSEARRLLHANPKARADALFRMRTFGSDKENPFTNEIFSQWAAKKNAVGLTNAQVASKQASKKVAKFSKQTAGGRSARTGGKSKTNVASEIAAMRKLPASILERSR